MVTLDDHLIKEHVVHGDVRRSLKEHLVYGDVGRSLEEHVVHDGV